MYPEETPYLLENGSVAVESEDGIVMYGASEFCFSNSIDMNNTEVKTLRGFGCIPPSATEIGTKNAVYAVSVIKFFLLCENSFSLK